MGNYLIDILQEHKAGKPVGIYSVCSANQFVLEAAMVKAKRENTALLIESTSNQVDQFGGYSGMNPEQFVEYVHEISDRMKFPFEMIILGGDHLGPNVWQDRPSDQAMGHASDQIRSYVQAGFTKIHLDASMRCLDDPGEPGKPLDPAIIAERTAFLCRTAEEYSNGSGSLPLYVIGTEVPIPGGANHDIGEITITSVPDLQQTIDLTRKAFFKNGLQKTWERVIAVVVQPGVEFSDTIVNDYQRVKAADLKNFIERYELLVYEAHSTDYQRRDLLKQMVEDHFAILKVGPALTFAFREVIFALALIEKYLLPFNRSISSSNILEIIEAVMKGNPKYWKRYYSGNEIKQSFSRKFSLSDRIRYYWSEPRVVSALGTLIQNLTTMDIPLTLISQYLPEQYHALRDDEID
ncbi:MAG: class II D-tagatose-bisphosphate aldolase, non-catalytic subunit, partial [Calditrichota bacterium]